MVLVEDIEANNHAKCNKISEPKNKLASNWVFIITFKSLKINS